MNNPVDRSSKNFQEEINLKEIIYALKGSSMLIATMVTLTTLIGIIYSLMAPQIWTSHALLTVAESENPTIGGSSSLGGLASIAGFNSSEGNIEGSKALAKVKSREFFSHLITFDDVLPNLMAQKSFDPDTQKTIFDTDIYDDKSKEWVNGSPTNWIAYKVYLKNIRIIMDPKTSFITVSISNRSPYFAESFLSLIIQEVNSQSQKKDLQESADSLNYLYQELANSSQTEVRTTISQLIESQLKKQMLARVKTDYILEGLDKPFVPKERTSPQRTRITIVSFFVGLILAVFFTLIRFYVKKNLAKFDA